LFIQIQIDRDLDVLCVFTNRTVVLKISCFISFITQNVNDVLQIDDGNSIQTIKTDQSMQSLFLNIYINSKLKQNLNRKPK